MKEEVNEESLQSSRKELTYQVIVVVDNCKAKQKRRRQKGNEESLKTVSSLLWQLLLLS